MRHLFTATVVAACMAVAPAASAQGVINERTTLKFDTAVMVPGATLQPGTYVFKTSPATGQDDIVEIWNEDETRLIATTLTIPAERNDVKGNTVITLARTSGTAAPALHRWFYPGRQIGHEFVYGEEEARRISDETKKIVLAHDAPAGSDMESLGRARLWRVGPGGERTEFRRDDRMGTQTAEQRAGDTRQMNQQRQAEREQREQREQRQMTQPERAAERAGTMAGRENLERHIAQIENLLDRMLEPRTGTVGTTGATTAERITVERSQLEQLRNHLQQLKRDLNQRQNQR